METYAQLECSLNRDFASMWFFSHDGISKLLTISIHSRVVEHPVIRGSDWDVLQCLWQYVVEEMNILTTVFLGDFNAKVWYPNSVLATKPITNYYRSPDMGDMFEFFIDITTTAEMIGKLKDGIGRWVFHFRRVCSVAYLSREGCQHERSPLLIICLFSLLSN